jgi:hypothetical protein
MVVHSTTDPEIEGLKPATAKYQEKMVEYKKRDVAGINQIYC